MEWLSGTMIGALDSQSTGCVDVAVRQYIWICYASLYHV